MGATLQQLEEQASELQKNQYLTIVKNIDLVQPLTDYSEMPVRPAQFFIADARYLVTGIKAVHNIAQTSADGASCMVSKAISTTADNATDEHLITDTAFEGDDNTYKGFNLKGIAAHTVTDCTLTTVTDSLTLAIGDRLVCGCNGTISSTVITLVTTLKRL